MKVYALVGKSGTGKSYQAGNLCGQMDIDYVIDDGLFIGGVNILAGRSAKRQDTMMGAIKTALFTDEDHRREVRERIAEVDPDSILVVGTSDRMIDQITERLGLPPASETIYIEDITTEEERRIAEKQRRDGKHVIPAPAMQLRRQFSGYFLNPLRALRTYKFTEKPRTVVRPTYSYLGNYTISDRVILNIVEHVAGESNGFILVNKVVAVRVQDGIDIQTEITVRYDNNMIYRVERFQRAVCEIVESMTGLNVEAVDIEIKGIRWVNI